MTAQMAMVMMSSNWRRLHWSIRGSSKAPKYSMMAPPFLLIATHNPSAHPRSLILRKVYHP